MSQNIHCLQMIKVTVKENWEVDINQWLPFSCPCKTTIYEWYIFILQLHVHYRKVKNRCESDALIPCQPETGLLAYFSRGAAWIWWQLQFVYWANMNLNVSFVVILILPWGLLEFITIIFLVIPQISVVLSFILTSNAYSMR